MVILSKHSSIFTASFLIQSIHNPCKEAQILAVKKNYDNIALIRDPCEEAQLEAVKQCGMVIQSIHNPSTEVQLAAIEESDWAIQHIPEPCREAIILYLSKVAPKLISDPECDLKWED
jgi:hypothetical protein